MYFSGIFTAPNSGNQTVLGLPFTPTRIKFTVDKSVSTQWVSTGEATSTSQEANTTHFDVVPSGETLSDNTKCLVHRQRQSGVLVTVLAFSFVSFGVNRFKINVTTPNASVPIFVECWS